MDQEQPKTKILKNGAVYDMEQHRIVANPGGGLAAFTSETARQAHAIRQERKRAVIASAANDAVERGDYRERFGDMAFVAAVAEAQYLKATTADDPKSTDAARFLLQESGLSESATRDTGGGSPSLPVVPGVVVLIAELARRVESGEVQIVDGKITESE